MLRAVSIKVQGVFLSAAVESVCWCQRVSNSPSQPRSSSIMTYFTAVANMQYNFINDMASAWPHHKRQTISLLIYVVQIQRLCVQLNSDAACKSEYTDSDADLPNSLI
jgi:hypothetical protein